MKLLEHAVIWVSFACLVVILVAMVGLWNTLDMCAKERCFTNAIEAVYGVDKPKVFKGRK